MRKLSTFVFMILIALAFNPAQAQSAYPSKPVVIVVLQPSGSGVMYAFSRALAQVLAPRLGQAVSIRNAFGASKMEFVGNEPADGYTILLSDSTMNLLPGLYTPVAPLAVSTDTTAWIGMSLPAATPKEVVDKLNAIVNAALKQPEFAEKLVKQGLKPTGGTPEELASLIRGIEPLQKNNGVAIANRQQSAQKTTESAPSIGRYEGDLVAGVRQGKGTLVFPSGARYEGDFVGGLRQGHGAMTYVTGDRYVGNWVDNWPHGKGAITYANGQRYEGDWVRDVKQGKGIYTWPSGQRYEGEFAGNEYSGSGLMTYANGDRFAGKWVEGKRTGDNELAQSQQAQQREAQASSSDGFLDRAVSLLGRSVIGGRGNPAAAVQGKAATEFVRDSMSEQTGSSDGFQWGKAAALLTGSAVGGLGKLSPELQGKVITGILKDSAGGQTGISNLLANTQKAERPIASANAVGARSQSSSKTPLGRGVDPKNPDPLAVMNQLEAGYQTGAKPGVSGALRSQEVWRDNYSNKVVSTGVVKSYPDHETSIPGDVVAHDMGSQQAAMSKWGPQGAKTAQYTGCGACGVGSKITVVLDFGYLVDTHEYVRIK